WERVTDAFTLLPLPFSCFLVPGLCPGTSCRAGSACCVPQVRQSLDPVRSQAEPGNEQSLIGANALHLAALRRLHFYDGSLGAEFEDLLGRGGCEQMHGSGNDPGPARLVTGAEPGAIVAVEVLIEQDKVAPMWVLLKPPRASIYRPPTILIPQEDI